jgi:hypothetical protein
MTSYCLALVTGMQLSFRIGIFGRSPTVGPDAAFKNFSQQLRNKSWHQLKVEHYTKVPKAALNGSNCEGFQTPAVINPYTRTAAVVWKPQRNETAGRGTYQAVPRAQLWGFDGRRATAEVSSEGQ